MSEAKHDMLLCGQSNSGMVEPAHYTAIALEQITTHFILTYAYTPGCPIDRTESLIHAKLLHRLVAEIGDTFLALGKATREKNAN
jgi:hypothetical protein